MLALGIAACSDSEPDPPPAPDPIFDRSVDQDERAAMCHAACDVLVGDCQYPAVDSEGPGDFDPGDLYACRAACLSGAFDDGELSCLASTACGTTVDCYE